MNCPFSISYEFIVPSLDRGTIQWGFSGQYADNADDVIIGTVGYADQRGRLTWTE